MMIEQSWTDGIRNLMETLTCRVRVLTLSHIHTGWNESFGSSTLTNESVERLVRAELLVGDVWNVPESPIGDQRLAQW